MKSQEFIGIPKNSCTDKALAVKTLLSASGAALKRNKSCVFAIHFKSSQSEIYLKFKGILWNYYELLKVHRNYKKFVATHRNS